MIEKCYSDYYVSKNNVLNYMMSCFLLPSYFKDNYGNYVKKSNNLHLKTIMESFIKTWFPLIRLIILSKNI